MIYSTTSFVLEYATTQFSAQAIKETKLEKEDAEFVSDLTAFMTDRQQTDDTLNVSREIHMNILMIQLGRCDISLIP